MAEATADADQQAVADQFEELIDRARSLYLYAIMRHHPGAVPIKGTSVYAIIHCSCLLAIPPVVVIDHLLDYTGRLEERVKELEDRAGIESSDPGPPRVSPLSLIESLFTLDNTAPASAEDKERAMSSMSEVRSMVGPMIDQEKARAAGILPPGPVTLEAPADPTLGLVGPHGDPAELPPERGTDNG